MTSFLAIERYSPFIILVMGLSTFAGLWGVGTALLHAVRLKLPVPLNHVTAILLGIQTASLAVQIFGMLGIATRLVLIAIWWSLLCFAVGALFACRPRKLRIVFPKCDWTALLITAIVGVAIVVNILIAIAPSTKIDELYYHMLVPSRIVSDGAFRFYRLPWEAAIWPQMIFQIASAPVHAMGYPDVMNVVSWGLFATLLWFGWQIMRVAGLKSASWNMLWIGSICVGIYPAVWNVTGGPHAMGNLAMAAAIVAFCGRKWLLADLSTPAYAALLSILLLSAATSKISLLPVCALLLCFAAWRLFRSASLPDFGKAAFALAAPWLIFLSPIALWCWAQSGSPFGPILAGTFGWSIYPAGWGQHVFQGARAANNLPFIKFIELTALDYSPLIWLGVIGAFVGVNLANATRAILAFFFALQCLIIYLSLPHDARFLGGLQYGLVIVFAIFATSGVQARFGSARAITAACVLFLVPWLGVQIFYAEQFLPVSLGLEKLDFYKREIAFYSDYVNLDRLLAGDTVLLVKGFRLNSVYAPRPVFFDEADLPPERPIVLFVSPTLAANISIKGYKLDDVLYENSQAVITTYRTPGRRPLIGALQVIKLIKSE
jgi:hypothetical protein